MPGKILDIKVKVGDAVGYGQCVIVMEAMKMETEIVASGSRNCCIHQRKQQAIPLRQVSVLVTLN